MKKKYYKVLNVGNRSCNGGSPDLVWSLPVQNPDGSWTPGEWMPEVKGKLELCANGYHLTDTEHLLGWLNATIYEAEPSKGMIPGDGKIVCRSVRLLKKMLWDDRIAHLFACDCAERVISIYEKDNPDDKRPRHAIEVARLFAEGKANDSELAAAWAAARAAARDAAWAAARAAAWDAARDAEYKWQIKRLTRYLEGNG
jgi:hypothetical protein